MNGIILLVSFLLAVSLPAQELNVMSFNIRLNIAADSLNAWPYRKDKVASQVLFHDVHILGVQEALHDQVLDLQQRLPNYTYTGVGRDDGKTRGEYSAIFYDTAKLNLLQSATFWLSLTPETPGSKSWDAAITRIVTWAEFGMKTGQKTFFVFNTHFDHIGQEARRESAKLLLNKIKIIAGESPVIILGDFNAKPSDEPIKILTNTDHPLHVSDSKELSITPHYGPSGTFNGFASKEVSDEPIDYIFLKGKWKVLQHATLSQTWGGRFSSDHFPVFAKISFD
jgi:endonuclease/exonuclease/phosphatase family metal-dependent hydrolase